MSQKKHVIGIEIECDEKQSDVEAAKRVLRWLEAFGHSSVSHGFEFIQVGLLGLKAFKEDK